MTTFLQNNQQIEQQDQQQNIIPFDNINSSPEDLHKKYKTIILYIIILLLLVFFIRYGFTSQKNRGNNYFINGNIDKQTITRENDVITIQNRNNKNEERIQKINKSKFKQKQKESILKSDNQKQNNKNQNNLDNQNKERQEIFIDNIDYDDKKDEIKSPQTAHPIINQKYNLWMIPLQKKIKLLQKIQMLNTADIEFTLPAKGKDQQTKSFIQEYEKTRKIIQWGKFQLKDDDVILIKSYIQKSSKLKEIFSYNAKPFLNKKGFVDLKKKFTNQQYYLAMKQISQLMNIGKFDNSWKKSYYERREQELLNQKYGNLSQKPYSQLPICVVMTNRNNNQSHIYFNNIQSLLKQEYQNYKIIYLFNKGQDKLAELIGKFLKFRKTESPKFVIISKSQSTTLIQNIYYGAHKYCGYNEILIIMNGQDELIGRKVFGTLNKLYQKQKLYLIHTQNLQISLNTKQLPKIGSSSSFPQLVIKQNYYSHYRPVNEPLRSMISDLFLLQQISSFKQNSSSKFYQFFADTSLWYSAYEMSCQNHIYLPELFYLETEKSPQQQKTIKYQKARIDILLKKRYKCLQNQLQTLQNI